MTSGHTRNITHIDNRYIFKLIDSLPGSLMCHRLREHFTSQQAAAHGQGSWQHLKIAGFFDAGVSHIRHFSPDTYTDMLLDPIVS